MAMRSAMTSTLISLMDAALSARSKKVGHAMKTATVRPFATTSLSEDTRTATMETMWKVMAVMIALLSSVGSVIWMVAGLSVVTVLHLVMRCVTTTTQSMAMGAAHSV